MSDNPYQATPVMDASSDGGGPDPNLDRSVSMLRQTKPWVRFIGVMMFLVSAFMVLGGLGMIGRMATRGVSIASVALGVVYIPMALFYIVPAVLLWRYADRIASFVQERSSGALASALEAQISFWKFVGILTLVVMAIYAVGIVVFAIFAVVVSSM